MIEIELMLQLKNDIPCKFIEKIIFFNTFKVCLFLAL